MTFLPVVERELRVAARRRGTYRSRFAAAVIAAVIAAWVLLSAGDNKEKGAEMLGWLSALLFLYTGIVGVQATSDCLSEEKREGTLGLLFLTDLKGYDVVIGKLAATSVNVFYGLLAVAPVLAIPLLLGGVTPAEVTRVVLVSVNLLLFFLGLGMAASAFCRQDHWAMALSIVVAAALLAAWPLATQMRRVPIADPRAALLSSPAYDCFLAFDTSGNRRLQTDFWINAAVTQLYFWSFLALACWRTPRSWQDAAAGKAGGPIWGWMRGGLAVSARTRERLLAVEPFLWRASRSRMSRVWVWLPVVAGGLFWFWMGRLVENNLEDWVAWDLLCLVGTAAILKCWLAVAASRTLSDDRRTGALELLLSTPLAEKRIVRGQLLALWRQFAAPVGALLLANLVSVIAVLRKITGEDRDALTWVHLFGGVFLVLDMLALSWVGMWLGLISRKANRAAMFAILRILALPWVVFIACLSLNVMSATGGSADWRGWLIFASALSLGFDLFFAVRAWMKLSRQFRTVVAEEPARRRSRKTPSSVPQPAEAQ